MEKHTRQEHDHIDQAQVQAHALPDEAPGKTSHQFKGIRLRKWGSWVAEIRMPRSRAKIWLGSYKTAGQAARAYDAALYCLRGPAAKFNFPDSVPNIPAASSLSRKQIQDAAAKYALGEVHSISPSTYNNSMEDPAFMSWLQPSSVSEMELSSDQEKLWKSLFAEIDGAGCLNFDEFPLIEDETLASDLFSTSEERHIYVDPTELWNFGKD